MFPRRISLIFLAIAALGAADENPTRAECINHLLRGFDTSRRMLESVMPPMRAVTCEGYQMMFNEIGGNFNDAGCSWGREPNKIFEARIMSLIQTTFTNDCGFTTLDGTPIDEVDTDLPGILCSPADELFTGVEHVALCVARTNSQRPKEGQSPSTCSYISLYSRCFEGLVDSCHDDQGESSEGILNLSAGFFGNLLILHKNDRWTRQIVDQVPACQGDQMGELARLQELDLDFEPGPLPSGVEEAFLRGTIAEEDSMAVMGYVGKMHQVMREAERIERGV